MASHIFFHEWTFSQEYLKIQKKREYFKNIEMQAQSAPCSYVGNKEKGWNKETETEKRVIGLWGEEFIKFSSYEQLLTQ